MNIDEFKKVCAESSYDVEYDSVSRIYTVRKDGVMMDVLSPRVIQTITNEQFIRCYINHYDKKANRA